MARRWRRAGGFSVFRSLLPDCSGKNKAGRKTEESGGRKSGKKMRGGRSPSCSVTTLPEKNTANIGRGKVPASKAVRLTIHIRQDIRNIGSRFGHFKPDQLRGIRRKEARNAHEERNGE